MLSTMLDDYQKFLLERATAFRDSNTVVANDWPAFQHAISTGWAQAFHCGEPACEDEIKPRLPPHLGAFLLTAESRLERAYDAMADQHTASV